MKRFCIPLLCSGFFIHSTCQKCTSSSLGFLKDSAESFSKNLPLHDKGVIGKTFTIEEEDIAQVISQKLAALQAQGKLQALIRKVQQKTQHAVQNPSPVKGLTNTKTFKRFTFDPTFEVRGDIKDHKGKLIHAKGKRLNPLDYVSFGEPLIFIDGTDPDQLKQFGALLGKLVLVKGSPLTLSKTLNKPVYFDQGGVLTTKFGITHVPCRVFQEGKVLVIEEVPVS